MWLFFRISLFLMNFGGQIICRIFPHCNVYYSFLIRQRLWAFRKKDTDVKCHFITIYQQCLLSTFLITIYIDSDHLAEVVFVVFSTVKLLFFFFRSFPFCAFWEEVTWCSSHWCKADLCSLSLRTGGLQF